MPNKTLDFLGGSTLDLSANWIWITQDNGSRNLTVCARRAFELLERPDNAYLDISADSRYVVYINGRRVGQGPARSWNHLKQYDRYEISRYLVEETNIIAVQVVRWGVNTGYYAGGPGGLIAQLTLDDETRPEWITDETWKMAVHPGYVQHVPRMAWGHAFTEQYDACFEVDDWTRLAFNDSSWAHAKVLGPVGTEPWTQMQARTIPMLTEQMVYPVRVFDACAVRPPEHSYAFDLYDAIEAFSAGGPRPFRVMVAELVSDRDAELTMVRMNATWDLDMFGPARVNGEDIAFTGDRATLALREGSNLLVVRFDYEKQAYPSWVFETDAGFSMKSPVGDGVIAFYASNSPDDDVLAACWSVSSVQDLRGVLAHMYTVTAGDRYTDVFALSNMRMRLPGVPVHIDSSYALCSDSAEYATVYRSGQGDIEFLLDFGEEIVGFVEFELDAPLGTVIDFNCFEAIVDGEWKWTDNLNNTLRYTTREGWQRFRSVVCRGFRYVQVTVRGALRPVRIHGISCLKNTYPVMWEGDFSCSDALLTQIWELGRRTTQLCMEDTFVDCPAYEQTFWVGDSRNEALVAYAAFGDTALSERCLRLAAESLWRSPMPEQAVPAGYGGIIPDWSMFWVLACEEYYRYTRDLAFAKEILPAVMQTCRFMLSRRNDQGLAQLPGVNMLDWAGMDCPHGCVAAHENILMVEALRRAAALADAVGAPDGGELRSEAESLCSAVNAHLWDEDQHAYIDSIHSDGKRSSVFSQQTQTMAYLFDCVPHERLYFVENYVRDVPEGWVRIGSPWMMWFSFEALARMGEYDRILEWTRRYWGEMLRYGATTCWETFPSWAAGRWTPTRSWCHAWSAAPTYFQSVYQLGVGILDSGSGEVLIAPQPCGLEWAKGRVPTAHGTISVSWKVEEGKFDLSVVLPEGVRAEVRVPDGYEARNTVVRQSVVSTSPSSDA